MKTRGFTLIEVMISMAVVLILAAAITRVLLVGNSSWHIGDAEVQVNQEARRGMSNMVRELRNTRPLSTIINVPADGAYYSTITFKIPSDSDGDGDVIDASGNVEWSDAITYSVANNQLWRNTTNSATVLANNVNSLSFRRQPTSSDIIEIALQTRKTTVEQRVISATLNCSVKLRN